MESFLSCGSKSKSFVSELEGEFAKCGMDTDERFINLQHALAMFGNSTSENDQEMLATEIRNALSILTSHHDA